MEKSSHLTSERGKFIEQCMISGGTRSECEAKWESRKNYKSLEHKVQDVDEKGIVTVYANAFGNIDSDGDISEPGSFAKSLSENVGRIKWFLNHDPRILLGIPFLKGSGEDSFGLKSIGQLNLKKQIGRDILEDYKLASDHDRTLEHSIGFEIVNSHQGEKSGNEVRHITEYKLWEKSTLTAWGANENTPMVDLKGNFEDNLQLLEQQLKYNYSDERLSQVEELIKSLRKKPDNSTSDEADVKSIFKSFLTIKTK